MIVNSRDEICKALEEIKEFQIGAKLPVKTRRPDFNYNLMGGIYPNTVVSIGGLSGSGKSWNAQEIEEDIFNPELNPHHKFLRLIRCNFEMLPRNLLLRKLVKRTGLDIDKLLMSEQSEYVNDIIRRSANEECDPRIFYYPDATSPREFYNDMEDFLKKREAEDRRIHTIITIDHIALIRSAGDKKTAIDELIERINVLKKRYNVSFIILSQLNREIKKRVDNPKRHAPGSDDFYQSDTIYQISDVQIAIHRPEFLGLTEYMAFKKGTHPYPWLEGYMNIDRTAFRTEGLVFWHYIKLRDRRTKERHKDICVEVLPGYEGRYSAVISSYSATVGGPPVPSGVYIPPTEEEKDNPFR